MQNFKSQKDEINKQDLVVLLLFHKVNLRILKQNLILNHEKNHYFIIT